VQENRAILKQVKGRTSPNDKQERIQNVMDEKSSDECNEKTDNETGDHGKYEEISEADAEPK
jgi:hypothetical protein